MVKKTGLIDQVQHAIETFRDNATLGAQFGTIPLPYFRELAVSIVQVFRDYNGDEIKEIEELQRENKTLRAITRGARKAAGREGGCAPQEDGS